MRECIYCGRNLEKNEICTCAMSVAKRMEKERVEHQEDKSPGKKKEKIKKERVKRPGTKRKQVKSDAKNAFIRAWRLFVSFVKSPADTVMNPGEMSWATIIVLVIFQGIITGLCAFSVITGAVRGPISFLGNAVGLKGLAGYEIIKGWLLAGISGALGGILVFYLYSGIFFAVNKWIIRQFSPYHEFVKRFAFVALPLSLLGILSVVLGMFSQTTFILLIICGLTGCVVITYEILRSMWYNKTPGKIMYLMMGCIFVFLLILINFIKFA